MKVAVVTPTIGSDTLSKCTESVQKQTYEDLTHYVFLDGKSNFELIYPTIYENSGQREIKTIAIEENVGKGWYGHKVYAACPFLVNADIICYLDEDNWYEPCHVEKIVNTILKGNDWAFSLRNIVDKNGNFICEDNCESLGKWPTYFNDEVFHIDTSSFGVSLDVAINCSKYWYGKWGADRQFFYALKKSYARFDCTKSYTLNYRLDGNANSVKKEFFIEGNTTMKNKYQDGFPWQKTNLIEIGPGINLIE
jgi:glycosyltransferase involved in cell wall biosynthesis